jgi:hypothetical protein
MKRKALLATLLFCVVFFPTTAALAQTTIEEGDFEFDDIGVPPTQTSVDATGVMPAKTGGVMPAQTGGLVCKVGHWVSGPRTCQNEHIGAVTVFTVCGNIMIGGRWYHILKIQRFPGRIRITVRRL